MKPGFLRTFALLSAIVGGALCPWAHVLSWLIRWLILGMLFVVFLGTRFSRESFQRSHFWLLLLNVAMGGAGYAVGWVAGGQVVAVAGFFAGIAPTATAAAVITGFLGGRVDYVVTAFLLTNPVVSALMPLLMPLALGHATPAAARDVALSVGGLVFLPLVVAAGLRRVYPPVVLWPARMKNASFYAWVLALFLIMAKSSQFLRYESGEAPGWLLVRIGLVSGVLCAANFAIGWLLGRVGGRSGRGGQGRVGGRGFSREASQALGQKNTTLTIYLALTYASPLIALGPTFYVIWHNVWNSWQLHRHGRKG
jgi:BASS family bile acid:Na+ symporter